MTVDDRKGERYRVHLSIRYGVARDFVVDYVENLSRGGLFIRGAHELSPRQEVEVELELPGQGKFAVTGKVAHILTPEMAESSGRNPGVGLTIVKSPDGFAEAMTAYLHRLGRRRDFTVFAADARHVEPLEQAGYRAVVAPSPAELVSQIARTNPPVLGVVVGDSDRRGYEDAAAKAGAAGVLYIVKDPGDFDELLADLDRKLPTMPG